MKKLGILMMCFAALAFVSCSSMSNLTSSNSVATANGTACGQALIGLYNNYKATKKLDLTNATNITNAMAIVTASVQLKQNAKDSNYRKAFTSGLVLGGAGIITSNNASSITSRIANATGLSSTTRSNISSAAGTLTSILSLLQ